MKKWLASFLVCLAAALMAFVYNLMVFLYSGHWASWEFVMLVYFLAFYVTDAPEL